jgi:hypothetical protein
VLVFFSFGKDRLKRGEGVWDVTFSFWGSYGVGGRCRKKFDLKQSKQLLACLVKGVLVMDANAMEFIHLNVHPCT